MIIKQQKICDVNDCYKKVSFITEEFLSNKVLWTCEKNKDLLNHTKDKKQKRSSPTVISPEITDALTSDSRDKCKVNIKRQ